MKPSQRRKKTHMDEVYDLQHLNGHFTRLWNQKTTIDNKTPRSFYLNPRSTHYIGKTAGRSKSADGRLKPSNLDLHRRVMSGNKKLDMRRTEFAPVDSLTGNLMARRYERRFLQSDIMEKNFYHFAQPERAFEPRTLLTNFTQPKIIKSRNYQPPVFLRRNRFFDAMNMKGKLNSTWNGHDQQKKKEDLWTASPEPVLARSLSPTASVFRDRISPNILKYSPRLSTTTTHRTRSALSRKSPHRKEDEELKYYQFVQEVTKDIIDRGVYSDRVLKNIIAHHMERRRNDLNMTRMRQLLMKLMDDLGVSQEGLFSTHAEKASHPENVHFNPELFVHEEESRRREWNATDALRIDDDLQNARNARSMLERAPKIASSEQYEEQDNSAADISLDDQDIDDILEGRNLDQLIARRSSKLQITSKHDESPMRERSVVQSPSSAVKSTNIRKEKIDQSAKSDSAATPSQYGSGQSDDEDTLGDEVSELEEDDVLEKSNQSTERNDVTSSSSSSTLTSQSEHFSSASSSASAGVKDSKLNRSQPIERRKLAVAPPPKRVINVNSNLPPVKKLSQQSRISSQDSIHIEATPPKKLSYDSDAEVFTKPTSITLPLNEFPSEDISIRTPSLEMEEDEEKESDEDVDENYSGSASSEASEVDSEEGSVSGWRKRDRDDEAAEVVEEEWKSGNAAEKVGTKNLSATTVTQTKIVDEAIDSSKEKGPSLEERENDGGHKMAERIAKPVISKPVSQVMERRVSGASDSEPPLSDSRRSPDPELLRQMRGSFLKQLEQQKAGKKGVDDDKGHEDQNRSRLGSEQVDDPPFGPSPTREIESASMKASDAAPAGESGHVGTGDNPPSTFATSENRADTVPDEVPKAPPRRIDSSPRRDDDRSEGDGDRTQLEESAQSMADDAAPSLPEVSQLHDESAPTQSHHVASSHSLRMDEDGSDNAFESENKEDDDSGSSESGDGSADIYASDPTGQGFDENDAYYPPLSPITELPETPARKEMEALQGSIDSNRSLKSAGFPEPVRSLQKPPIPAPRRISNASNVSYENDRYALDDQPSSERRVSNASMNNSTSEAANAIE